jgi:hypothetical protein
MSTIRFDLGGYDGSGFTHISLNDTISSGNLVYREYVDSNTTYTLSDYETKKIQKIVNETMTEFMKEIKKEFLIIPKLKESV